MPTIPLNYNDSAGEFRQNLNNNFLNSSYELNQSANSNINLQTVNDQLTALTEQDLIEAANIITLVQSNSAIWNKTDWLPISGGTITHTLEVTGNCFFNYVEGSEDSQTTLTVAPYKKVGINLDFPFEQLTVNGSTKASGALVADSFGLSRTISPALVIQENLVSKLEIFDKDGLLIGFIPIYSIAT